MNIAVLPDRFGHRIRSLRDSKGLSLRDLAAVSGVSVPMLSQVERGESSPTIAVAERIAAGLHLSLSQLLRLDESQDVSLVRSTDRRVVLRNGHRYEEVTAPLPGERASVTLHTLKAGARTGGRKDAPLHSPGSRETVITQTGRVTLVLDGRRYELRAGDTITFDADLPHHFENSMRTEAAFLAIVTAGLRIT
ncbi:MAG: helix-turn-helix domain-containing protein [Actinomycetota bacterium]|nr:XRE family transcriptional regulator [Actinomycetota bacterium]